MLDRRCDVGAEDAGRADQVVRRLTEKSWSEVRGMFDQGCVAVNGSPCTDAGRILAAGDVVAVRFDPRTRYREKPAEHVDRAFAVVFEDEHLIVVEKAAAVLTVSDGSNARTLVDAVSERLSRRGGRTRALVVHRLDRGVSGLLVMAKRGDVAGRLQGELRSRHMEREYLGIVAGAVSPAEGTFDSFLITRPSLDRRSSEEDDDGAERAVTHYRTVRSVRGATAVRVRLETGRRHQIRVHFAEAGYPVLGDTRYWPDKAKHPWWTAKRLALHAASLSFTHPVTGEPMRFESPPPREFGRFLPVG